MTTTWIGFLRAINLGATRKFPKADIITAVERAGGADVATYINTGNVRFDHDVGERAEVEALLEDEFARDRGFDVPTICFTPDELQAMLTAAEVFGHDGQQHVSLLKNEVTPEATATIEGRSTESERAVVRGRAVHLLLGENYHQAKLTNATVERDLGVATARNLNVIRTLVEKWCS